jgi:hypothetical protein
MDVRAGGNVLKLETARLSAAGSMLAILTLQFMI